jgi:hypothetical protein
MIENRAIQVASQVGHYLVVKLFLLAVPRVNHAAKDNQAIKVASQQQGNALVVG